MKICVTSIGDNLESQMDPRFGRCVYFIIWDNTNNSFESIINPNVNASSGAGIQSAQLVVSKSVSVVITGKIGPKAEQILRSANLKVITTEKGIIKDILAKYTNDHIKSMPISSTTSECESQGNAIMPNQGIDSYDGEMRRCLGNRIRGSYGVGGGKKSRGKCSRGGK